MFNKKFTKDPTEKQKIGQIGEDFACKYLEDLGFEIMDRNYLRKWGELDIVVKKGKKIHFVEVKSVSRLHGGLAGEANSKKVIHETNDSYRPEDNMHPWKLKRLGRAIQSYLLEKDISDDVDWQFDVASVYIDMDKRPYKVSLIEDVVL